MFGSEPVTLTAVTEQRDKEATKVPETPIKAYYCRLKCKYLLNQLLSHRDN